MTALKASNDTTRPFQTYADVMVFAAAMGTKRDKYLPVVDIAKAPDPIGQDIFAAKGYDSAINWLTVAYTKNPKILASGEGAEGERTRTFEGYANAGVEILEESLMNSVDYSGQILLLLDSKRLILSHIEVNLI